MCIFWHYFSFLSIDLWRMVPVVLDAPVMCEYVHVVESHIMFFAQSWSIAELLFTSL